MRSHIIAGHTPQSGTCAAVPVCDPSHKLTAKGCDAMAASDYFDKDCNTTPLSGLELQSIITPDECGWIQGRVLTLILTTARACELAGYPGRCRGGSQRPWWRDSRVCAGMRARRVPGPQPGRHTASVRCMRARRVPAPLPGRLTASMRCVRTRRVPGPLPGLLTASMRCMRARRVPRPPPGRLTASTRSMRARRVPRPLLGRLVATVALHSRACAGIRARRVPAAQLARLDGAYEPA